MAKAFPIQARSMARFAKKNNLQVEPGSGYTCAKAVLAKMVGLTCYPFADAVARKANHDIVDIYALEAGYEGWEDSRDCDNRYYKVGQRFRKLTS
jgi:hypothetical protein